MLFGRNGTDANSRGPKSTTSCAVTRAGKFPTTDLNNPAENSAGALIRTVDVIRKKRDGRELSRAEIDYLVRGYARGEIPDYRSEQPCREFCWCLDPHR